MAKRVFFSFHYEDVKTFRANVVRNHGVTKQSGQDAGFFDASIWEDAKRHGDASVKSLINDSLEGTSVTCTLIGTETWKRRWVRYEILKSYDRGNALLGIHINNVRDKNQNIFTQGINIFDYLGFTISVDGTKLVYYERNETGWKIFNDLPMKPVKNINSSHWGKFFQLSSWVKTYDWILDNGYNNFAAWV